jgi:hypothetical protein
MKMRLKTTLTLIALATPALALAQPPRNFDGLTCQSNIEQELNGRQMTNEPVVNLEARYKSLNLKDDGADEISGQLNAVTWRICGNQVVLLMKKDRVKAVLKIPEQYRDKGDIIPCEPVDKSRKGYYLAVPGKNGPKGIHTEATWRLDEKTLTFTLEPVPLECEHEPGM